MMQLYFAPGACSFVPHTMMEDSGLAFEPVMLKLHKGEQNAEPFRSINPRGQVPVLVDHGVALTQIVALCLHIDALCPQRGFFAARADGAQPGGFDLGLDEQHGTPDFHAYFHAAKIP